MESPAQKEVTEASKHLLTSEQVQKDTIESAGIQKKKKQLMRIAIFLVCGIFNTILGFFAMRYNFVELIMEERIRMRPGLPPYEMFRNPPLSVLLSVTIFNVTNAIQFLDGIDDKLKLEEVGPIFYAETIHQKDIVHHYENSTMSFTTERNIHFLPEKNEPGILNRSMITVNPSLIGLAAYLHDSSFIQKFAFRMLSSSDNVFMRKTVYELLWHTTTPMIERMSSGILSVLLPRNNSGILYNAFYPNYRRYNVRVGTENGFKDFFKMNTYNGQSKIPGFEYEKRSTCPISLEGARDGANLPPYTTKDTVITVWREDICTTFNFLFDNEVNSNGFKALKFKIPANSFDRLDNKDLDCHRGNDDFPLPSGLIDSSKCSFDVPTAVSFPHYYGSSNSFHNKYVEGLEPNEAKHGSYAIVEPTTGIPLEEVARLQNNIVIPKLDGFNEDIQKFSNMILPGFWMEYSMKQLPPDMAFLVKLIVFYTPIIQMLATIVFVVLGAGFLYFGIIYLLQTDPKSPRKILITKMNPFRVKNVPKSPNDNKT